MFIYGCFFSQTVPAHPSGKGRLGARYVLRSNEEVVGNWDVTNWDVTNWDVTNWDVTNWDVTNWDVTKYQRKDVDRSGKNDQHVMTLSVGTNTLFRNVCHVLPTDANQQPSIPTTFNYTAARGWNLARKRFVDTELIL